MTQPASILIVDDEEDIRQLLFRVLSRAGYRATVAKDAHAALDLLQHQAFDLLITDLRMPGGLDGLDLLRLVAQQWPSTKGIILTGYGSIQNAVEATKLGADNYVTKPIVISEFLETIRATLTDGKPLRAAPVPLPELRSLARLTQLLAQPPASMQALADGSVGILAEMLSADATLCITDETSGQALAGAQTRQTENTQPFPPATDGHTLAVQLAAKPSIAGTLKLARQRHQPPFAQTEAILLQVVADQLGIALSSIVASRSLERTMHDLREAGVQMVTALVRAVEVRDHYTAGHSMRVAHFAVMLANALSLPPGEVESIRIAALLHDVGKVGVSDLILNKPGPLTDEERSLVEQHPTIGCQIISGIPALAPCLPLVRHHQERYDGLGYPDRLAGEQIPLGARILAVADSFEAITADRAYRRGRTPAEALEILVSGAGHHWDPALVELWRQVAPQAMGESPCT
ncbi:MAG: HD domain-containing phosphohydrolase [Anaerolineae bacterium]